MQCPKTYSLECSADLIKRKAVPEEFSARLAYQVMHGENFNSIKCCTSASASPFGALNCVLMRNTHNCCSSGGSGYRAGRNLIVSGHKIN